MPTIKRFDAFKVTMYAEDHNPPHIHIVAPGFEATVRIGDGTILAGEAPAKALRAVQTYIVQNRLALFARWAELKRERP